MKKKKNRNPAERPALLYIGINISLINLNPDYKAFINRLIADLLVIHCAVTYASHVMTPQFAVISLNPSKPCIIM